MKFNDHRGDSKRIDNVNKSQTTTSVSLSCPCAWFLPHLGHWQLIWGTYQIQDLLPSNELPRKGKFRLYKRKSVEQQIWEEEQQKHRK